MATLIIAVNEPTNIPQSSLSIDTFEEQILVGYNHTLSMQISDLNGIESIDMITVNLLDKMNLRGL